MRIDWYPKGVLTVIAVLLGVIAIRPYVSPDAVAHAQTTFAGVEFSAGPQSLDFFDSRTGDIWTYASGDYFQHNRLTKLGDPLVKVQ